VRGKLHGKAQEADQSEQENSSGKKLLVEYQRNAQKAEAGGVKLVDPRMMAFGVLVTGSQPGQSIEQALWNNNRLLPGFEAAFNSSLREIGDSIIDMAEKSCEAERAAIQPGSWISFDGSWEHRRNSRRCITTIFCRETQRIISFAVIDSRNAPGRSRYRPVPQNLEAIGLEQILPDLLSDARIVGIYMTKARNLIQSLTPNTRPPLQEVIDTGHATKSLEWKIRRCTGMKEELASGLRRWMRMLLTQES
jgi:hypothetical protein